MLSDLYTYIIGYVTPRTNGAEAARLIAGPDWVGDPPPGIKRVFHASTQLALAFFPHAVVRPRRPRKRLAARNHLQVQPLSPISARRLHPTPPAPEWIEPLDVRKAQPRRTSSPCSTGCSSTCRRWTMSRRSATGWPRSAWPPRWTFLL